MVSTLNKDKNHGNVGEGRKTAETASASEKTYDMDTRSPTRVARVPQPLFSVMTAPKVTSMARDAFVEWLKRRKEYEEAVKERCKDGKQDINAVMKSVQNSFDEDLLETICEASWRIAITRTGVGSVQIVKPVKWLIVPGDSTEFLLGNDVLATLGIDVQRQLDMFVTEAVQNSHDDEWDEIDEPHIGSSVELDDECRVAVESLVETAVAKGFPGGWCNLFGELLLGLAFGG
ncbi:hypothetical protein PC128_g17652 [Phytophthora cactorum]|nr:hypothetical protein PC128_g17652 [Phytophthora cactorum]